MSPDELQHAFDATMARLGPWPATLRLAAGVSGGADSMALALLADTWARTRGGSVLALIVDHGLRPEAVAEAAETAARLGHFAIQARILRLCDLPHGSALAARARAARYRALSEACRVTGRVHLLLGHHAGDQAETLMIRVLGGSGNRGLAAMPAVSETGSLRLLRPLLRVPKRDLKLLLQARGMAWVEDPSNIASYARRSRLRALHADPGGISTATWGLCDAARSAGEARAASDMRIAAELAERVRLYPEGFAVLSPGPISPDGLSALVQMIGGAAYPPATEQIAGLAAAPRPATMAGVRLIPGRRFGPGLLMMREAAAMSPPVPACAGALWDGRFRMIFDSAVTDGPDTDGPDKRTVLPPGAAIGALGAEAAHFRRLSPLPSAVLHTLPAIRDGKSLVMVPHLLYPDARTCLHARLVFHPSRSAAGATFAPA